jgi:hypothetical protein
MSYYVPSAPREQAAMLDETGVSELEARLKMERGA